MWFILLSNNVTFQCKNCNTNYKQFNFKLYCLDIDSVLLLFTLQCNEILKPFILAFYRQTNSIIQAKFSKTFPFKCQDLGCTGLVWPEYRKGPVISKTMQISVFCKNIRLFSYSSLSCHCFSWPQDTRNWKINTARIFMKLCHGIPGYGGRFFDDL